MSISKTPAPAASRNAHPTANQGASKGNQPNSKQGSDKSAAPNNAAKPSDKPSAPVSKPPSKPLGAEVFLDESDEENDIKCDKCMQSFWFKKELVTHLVDIHKISEEEQEKERQRKAAALREAIRRKALAKQMEQRQRMAQGRMEQQRRSAMTNQQQLHSALARANQAARLRNEQRLAQERNSLSKRRELQSMQERNARAKRLELQMLIERRNRLMSQTSNKGGLPLRARDLGSGREIRLGSGIVIQRSDPLPPRVEADEDTIFKFHYDADNRFVCQLCQRKFGAADAMVQHWKTHVKVNLGKTRMESRVGQKPNQSQKRKRDTITLDESESDDVKADSDYEDSRKSRSKSSSKNKKGSKRYNWENNDKKNRQKSDRERRAEERSERTKKKKQSKNTQWTPYLMWSIRFKNKLMAEFPEWSSSEINKATSEGWKNVSENEVLRLDEEVNCVNDRIQCRKENNEYWTAYKLWAKRMKTEMLEENPDKKDYEIQKDCERDWEEVRKEYKDILEDQVTVINRHNLSSKKGKPICNAFLLWSIETMTGLQTKDSNTTEAAVGKAITEGWQEVEEEKLDALVAESVRINQLLSKQNDDSNSKKKGNDDEDDEEEIGDDEDWDPFVVQLKKVQDIINEVEGKGEMNKKRKITLKQALQDAKKEAKETTNDAWDEMEPEVVVNSDDENDNEDSMKVKREKSKKVEKETVDIDDDEVLAEKVNINIALTEGKSIINDLKETGVSTEEQGKEGKNYSQEEFDNILNKTNDRKKSLPKNNDNKDSDDNEPREDMDGGAERDIEQCLNEEEITKQLEKDGIHITELSGKSKEENPSLSKATIESAQRLGLSYKDLFLY